MAKKILLMTLFAGLWMQAWCQRKALLGPGQPIRLLVFHGTNQLEPGLRFGNQDFHPGAMIGTEWKLNQHPRSNVFVAGNIGGYHHKLLSSGIFLTGELGYRYRSSIGLFAQVSAGVGYARVFYPGEVYEFDEGAQRFQKASNTGHSAMLVPMSLALGYKMGSYRNAPELLVFYQYAPELPFSLSGLHQFLGLGLSFYPFKN
ncbi:MAG: hypothetical protein AAGA10_20095 [Bacteroidota bacterium]